MNTHTSRRRLHRTASAIHGTTGEFRRVAILNFCAVALEFLAV